ncbi:MAG: LPXTG cell wall anchor domain-containing protein [Oscillospiraceae bacterium]|nr:LPXTG cell wall anchor domain-containing protein [Oscillospiraceae bacterium]
MPKATDGQQIINTPEGGYELPSTGGHGTRFFTILGSILILGAGVLLWRRRRLV